MAIAMAKNFNAVKSKKNKPKCSGYFVIMSKVLFYFYRDFFISSIFSFQYFVKKLSGNGAIIY
jgi:hypothetical protein